MMRHLANKVFERNVPVGTKIWFDGEKQAYTVRASNTAYCVCTKPFNLKKTVLYTIIDWEYERRGPEDLIFSMGAETDKQCEEMLERITNGDSEVSSRHGCLLLITKAKRVDKQ